jgi:hypothetical protein
VNVTYLKSAILLCRNAGITPWVWGHRGMGKSSTVKQLAEAKRWGWRDMRASQLESSDFRGLPDKVDGRTVYYPPEDLPFGEFKCLECEAAHGPCTFGENGSYADSPAMPSSCPAGHANRDGKTVIVLNEGLLFLDELNRADDDVLQASFQLVLDRCIGRYKLPTGWTVVAAGNYSEGYSVNNFNDPAFLDRFCHLQLTPGKEYMGDWTTYMAGKCSGIADKIIQFVCFDDVRLLGKLGGVTGLGFSVTASPRSWEFVARVLAEVGRAAKDESALAYDNGVVREVVAGIVGTDNALSFEKFSIEVTPADVLDKGVKAVYDKLKSFNRNQLTGLVWGVANHAKERFKDPKQRPGMMDNALDFMEFVARESGDRDMAVMLGRQLVDGETHNLGAAVMSNAHLAQLAKRYKGTKNDSWIAAMNERQDLQQLMSKVSYGNDLKDAKGKGK